MRHSFEFRSVGKRRFRAFGPVAGGPCGSEYRFVGRLTEECSSLTFFTPIDEWKHIMARHPLRSLCFFHTELFRHDLADLNFADFAGNGHRKLFDDLDIARYFIMRDFALAKAFQFVC